MIERVRLYKNAALSLGASLAATFEGVAGEIEGLTRKLLGIEVRMNCELDQTAGTAALTKEEVWNILQSFSFQMNGHTFCENMKGSELRQLNFEMGMLSNQNTDCWTSADTASNVTSDTSFIDYFVFPTAPGFWINNAKDDSDAGIQGAIPAGSLGASASVAITIDNALTADWVQATAKYLTIEITAVFCTDERKIAPAPVKYEALETSNNPAVLTRDGAFVSAFMGSRTAGSVTLPTGECSANVSGVPLFSRLTGLSLVGYANVNRPDDGIDDLIDTNVCPIIDPLEARNALRAPSGRYLEMYNLGAQQTSPAYMVLYHVRPTTDLTRLFLKSQGLEDAIGPNGLDLGRCYLNGQPIQGQGFTGRTLLGASYMVR